jgi:hypothetical protein
VAIAAGLGSNPQTLDNEFNNLHTGAGWHTLV